MTVLSFDTETALFRPGCMAPPLACVTWQLDGDEPRIIHGMQASPVLEDMFTSGDLITGANTAYDIAVLLAHDPSLAGVIFDAYDRDRVTDVQIREKLIRIGLGSFKGTADADGKWHKSTYSLDDITSFHLGYRLDKDTWRLRYGEFLDTPLEDWPEGARTYPLEDAKATLAVHKAQDTALAGEVLSHLLTDQFRQSRAALALHLTSAWGLRTHGPSVDKLEAHVRSDMADVQARLVEAGLVRKNGTRDTKAAAARMVEVCEAAVKVVRRTAPTAANPQGNICLDADACEYSGDAILGLYAEYSVLASVLSKDVPMLRQGTKYPIHTRFNLVETGRTSSSGPNVQNLRRAF